MFLTFRIFYILGSSAERRLLTMSKSIWKYCEKL